MKIQRNLGPYEVPSFSFPVNDVRSPPHHHQGNYCQLGLPGLVCRKDVVLNGIALSEPGLLGQPLLVPVSGAPCC